MKSLKTRYLFFLSILLHISFSCNEKTRDERQENTLNIPSKGIETTPEKSLSLKETADIQKSANEKLRNYDFQGALADFNTIILREPKKNYPYFGRGKSKLGLFDYRGAINDFNITLNLINNSQERQDTHMIADIYYNMGTSKWNLDNNTEAIRDFTKSIEIQESIISKFSPREIELGLHQIGDLSLSQTYYRRGISKLEINQKDSGCLDFSRAGELGISEAYQAIKIYCN